MSDCVPCQDLAELTLLCKRRDGRCPCLEHLPKDLVAKVWELIGESQRHYALTLAHRYWERNGLWPPKVPSLMRVRGERFCYSCDSQDHRYLSSGHNLYIDLT